MSKKKAQVKERLWTLLEQISVAHESGTEVKEALHALEIWQKKRLNQTYADLRQNPRYTDAMHFFVNQLYAPTDLLSRDTDLRRVYPVMLRMLSASMLETVADAAELQCLTMHLDVQLAQLLSRRRCNIKQMSALTYAHGYQDCNNQDLRQKQLRLIISVGSDLDKLVRKPSIVTALKMTAIPARIAGLGALQDFLEDGFGSFRKLRGAAEFLEIIEERENKIMNALFDGLHNPFMKEVIQ